MTQIGFESSGFALSEKKNAPTVEKLIDIAPRIDLFAAYLDDPPPPKRPDALREWVDGVLTRCAQTVDCFQKRLSADMPGENCENPKLLSELIVLTRSIGEWFGAVKRELDGDYLSTYQVIFEVKKIMEQESSFSYGALKFPTRRGIGARKGEVIS